VRPWQTYVENALRAEHFMRRDADYIVRDNKVLLVDQYTGRIFTDRSWQDGLHQAVEWKEGVPLTAEKHALARISRQRFYGRYRNLCGMTGTATGHEAEFRDFYRLPVVVIPERIPSRRQGWPTRWFRSEEDKWRGITEEMRTLYHLGRPVLVGTRTIQESEGLSQVLSSLGLPHQILNGKQDDDEAALVARAGERQTLTIATNMAGRGTDIRLGPGIAELGGLHVIATQRQESRRVDRQLIGRCGRQGDPGSYRFYVCADDLLIQQFQPALGDRLRAACGDKPEVTRGFEAEVDRVQRMAEAQRYEQRCQLHRHDEWMNDILTTVAERSSSERDATPSRERTRTRG
ncbi:MAG TPA: preprotein translocase subunit SecA, partial [Pirellulaceae bacterium]